MSSSLIPDPNQQPEKRYPRLGFLILGQTLLAIICTYLISKISWIGKIGIATVHKEYRFLRSGWRTFFLLAGVQLIVVLLLYLTAKKFPRKVFRIVCTALLVIALIGLFVTFQDFQHTYTHRLLKEPFHLAFYLFWFGWIVSCIYFMLPPPNRLDSNQFPIDPNIPAKDH